MNNPDFFIGIGESISKQYLITDYLGDFYIFHSYVAIDNFNNKKVRIDFVKNDLLKSEKDIANFINSLREEKFRQHDNLVLIYDYGNYKDNYYVVTEMFEAITLLDMVNSREETLTIEEIEPIISQISEVLNLIHEDSLIAFLIPDNILLTKDSIKIRNTFWFKCFKTNLVLNHFSSRDKNYPYLSPELKNKNMKLSPASDIYSLGIVISYLVSKKVDKDESLFNSQFPEILLEIFNKCVNYSPNERYQTIDDFLLDFDSIFVSSDDVSNDKTRVVNTGNIFSTPVEDDSISVEQEIQTYAHPYGAVPRNYFVEQYLKDQHDVIMLATGGMSPHPLSNNFDVKAIPRIEADMTTFYAFMNRHEQYVVSRIDKLYYEARFKNKKPHFDMSIDAKPLESIFKNSFSKQNENLESEILIKKISLPNGETDTSNNQIYENITEINGI